MPSPPIPSHPYTATTLFTALILGARPAGLSAALALSRLKHPVALFSNSQFRNSRASHAHKILSRDHTPPGEIRRVAKEQIEAYGTTHFVERSVVSAWKNHSTGWFEVKDEEGQVWRGKKVVLAMGVRDVLPRDIEGYEEEKWGYNIYQCLFCDGLERSDRPAGVLGFESPMQGHNVGMMLQMGCPKVTIFGNGKIEPRDEGTRKAVEMAKLKGAVVDERRISRLVNLDREGIDIQFEDGSSMHVGFLAHWPPVEVVAPEIARGLGVEIVDDGAGGEILKRSEPFGETNVEGVLAAGDCGILMRQVTAAMFQGTAAGGGVHFLIARDEERVLEGRLAGEKGLE